MQLPLFLLFERVVCRVFYSKLCIRLFPSYLFPVDSCQDPLMNPCTSSIESSISSIALVQLMHFPGNEFVLWSIQCHIKPPRQPSQIRQQTASQRLRQIGIQQTRPTRQTWSTMIITCRRYLKVHCKKLNRVSLSILIYCYHRLSLLLLPIRWSRFLTTKMIFLPHLSPWYQNPSPIAPKSWISIHGRKNGVI